MSDESELKWREFELVLAWIRYKSAKQKLELVRQKKIFKAQIIEFEALIGDRNRGRLSNHG